MLLRINETILARGYLKRVLKNSITIKMSVSSKELATEFRPGESIWLPGVLPKHFPAFDKAACDTINLQVVGAVPFERTSLPDNTNVGTKG